jgi:hypothetical protein
MRCRTTLKAVAICLLSATMGFASEIRGTYLESRTCQVYTGPCFANGEMGLAGRGAIMAWQIDQGQQAGTDLSGLNVVAVLRASNTLGHQGVDGVDTAKSVVYVDDRAGELQRKALVEFARRQLGKAGSNIVRIEALPIEMSLDVAELKGNLKAGKAVELATRRAKPGDCICGNEVAFYPPLAQVENFAPGVSLVCRFSGRGLGQQWASHDSRSAYMATFTYE